MRCVHVAKAVAARGWVPIGVCAAARVSYTADFLPAV